MKGIIGKLMKNTIKINILVIIKPAFIFFCINLIKANTYIPNTKIKPKIDNILLNIGIEIITPFEGEIDNRNK